MKIKAMKSKILLVFAIATTLFMFSCSKEKKEGNEQLSVKPKSTQIKGDLGDYFEVVEKDYKIPLEENSFNQIITVEVKRKDVDFPFDVNKINPFGTNGGEEYHVGFGIELLGDNGPITVKNATEGGMGGPYSSEDVSSLFKLKKGESGYIRWTIDKADGIKSFQLTSALQKEDSSNLNSNDSSIDNGQNVSSVGSSDYDKMLDDYEEYVNQYIIFYKKAQTGDQSALTEYPAMMEKAANLQESMEKAQNENELNSTQVARMMRIQAKMVEGMQ